MIFQFKVQLLGLRPPVWRRLQLKADSTFVELHEVIQEAFEWYGFHLHSFRVTRSRGKRVNRVEIGTELDVFDDWIEEEMFDEYEEKLSDWFFQEKDRVVYTYDFGDDWEHEIVLEKILEPKEGKQYPYCVKAMRMAPPEDSRGMLLSGDLEIEEIPTKELTADVNRYLAEYRKEVEKPLAENVWGELFACVQKFFNMKPWNLLDDNQVIVVEDPHTDELLYCTVLGAAGEEFGLAVYIGNEGLQAIDDTLTQDVHHFDILMKQRSLLLSFSDYTELVEEDLELIERANISVQGRNYWPHFRSFVPQLYPWFIDEQEANTMIVAIEQVIALMKEYELGLYFPRYKEKPYLISRVYEKDEWSTKKLWMEPFYESLIESYESSLVVSELEAKRVSKWKKYNNPIEFDCFYLDMPMQSEEGARPYFPFIVVALDQKTKQPLFQEIVEAVDEEQTSQFYFLKMIQKLKQMPREIWIRKSVRLELEPLLKLLPCTEIEVETLPTISQFKEYLQQMIDQDGQA